MASLCLLAVMIAAGGAVRRYVSGAFESLQRIQTIRFEAQDALKLQLDEETGIRGLAATGDDTFLQPYSEARSSLGAELEHLRVAFRCCGLTAAVPFLEDAVKTRAGWDTSVALPIVLKSRARTSVIQTLGKRLMDRYRADFAQIDRILYVREIAVASAVQDSIAWIDLTVGLFVGILLIATISYVLVEARTAARFEAQKRIAEDERRRGAEMRTAYETEKRIADTLQEAFTDRPLPALETLRFSASYVAATEDTLVGGDWYDAMALTGNRAFFAIGDVTGHGIEAAVAMNRARHALISAALVDSDPAAVLDRVNTEVARANATLVTAIVGIADAEKYEFIYAVAGHPPPALLEPGRLPRFLECGSLPLGAVAGTRYFTRRVQSVPGAILILYTDGAVEHSRNVIEGEQFLLEAIAEVRNRSDDDAAASIHKAIFSQRPLRDDVAILTIGFAAQRTLGLVTSGDKAQAELRGRVDLTRKADLRSRDPRPERFAS